MSGTSEPDPDLGLLKSLVDGDDSALTNLMDQYEKPIFHFIYRHVLNENDARDLAQEVFVKLFFNAAKFRPEAKFSTWLYQIALNLCLDHFKSRRMRQAARTDSRDTQEIDDYSVKETAVNQRTPSDEALAREKLTALNDGIAALPHDLRSALILTTLEQRSHLEAATLLKTTPKAVETRVYRARKFLVTWMTKTGFVIPLVFLFC